MSATILVAEFDGIHAQDAPNGRVLVFLNGTIAVVPQAELLGRFGAHALDALAERHGLVRGLFNAPYSQSFGYRSALQKPAANYVGPLIDLLTGGKRIPRSSKQLELLQVFISAFSHDRLQELLEGHEPAVASPVTLLVQPGAHEACSVSKTSTDFQICPNRRLTDSEYCSLTKTVGGRWDRARKVFCVPLRNEPKLKRFLARIEKAAAAERTAIETRESKCMELLALIEERTYATGLRVSPCKFTRQTALYFPYDMEKVRQCKAMRARFNPADRSWRVPLESTERLVEFLAEERAREALRLNQQAHEREMLKRQAQERAQQAPGAPEQAAAHGTAKAREYRWFANRAGSYIAHGAQPQRILSVGELYQDPKDGTWLVCTFVSKPRYVPDAESLGGDEPAQYEFLLRFRLANESEVSPHLQRVRRSDERAERLRKYKSGFTALRTIFQEHGVRPEREQVQFNEPVTFVESNLLEETPVSACEDGSVYHRRHQSPHYVLDEANGFMWRVEYNGLDGDDWSRNNHHGTHIASRLPLDPEVARFLRDAAQGTSTELDVGALQERACRRGHPERIALLNCEPPLEPE